jgi:hypothetical protein
MISVSARIFFTIYIIILLSIPGAYPQISSSELHPIRNMISASRRILFVLFLIFAPRDFVFTPQNKLVWISFNKKNDLRITAHFLFLQYFLPSVLQPLTPQNKVFWSSFNKKNDQRFKAHLFWKTRNFRLQYFRCLPLKISSSEFHSILKMISASRRIFFEKHVIFGFSISGVYPSK